MVMYSCRSCMVSVILLHLLGAGAPAQTDRFYGEPVELRSNYIYFMSWKYVR